MGIIFDKLVEKASPAHTVKVEISSLSVAAPLNDGSNVIIGHLVNFPITLLESDEHPRSWWFTCEVETTFIVYAYINGRWVDETGAITAIADEIVGVKGYIAGLKYIRVTAGTVTKPLIIGFSSALEVKTPQP